MCDDWTINLSNLFYFDAIKRIGSEGVIRDRRMVIGLKAKLEELRECSHDHLPSGSRAEGFLFDDSDFDEMIVYRNIKVVMNYNSNEREMQSATVLKIETNQTRPGFCLLRLLSVSNAIDMELLNSLVSFENGIYLSSALWRNEVEQYFPQSTHHGPCENGFIAGTEHDKASCLKCTKWPESALPCINRLYRAKWPLDAVLGVIVRNGCHLVPIGDKNSEKEIMEWRISFSEAEKTLIHEMNHCQFLCYGLLKIFLKEVINTREDVNGLLCSYFLKTAVFWEISYNRRTWIQENFMLRFWDCFRRLLSWVSHGYCPNFFIPENNMFLGKIFGRSKRILLNHLTSLYNQGYKCIPVCKCDNCMIVLSHPNFAKFAPFHNFSEKVREDLCLISNILSSLTIGYGSLSVLHRHVVLMQHIKSNCESRTKLLTADIYFHHYIQYAFYEFMHFSIVYSSCNKNGYGLIRRFCKALKRSKIDILRHDILIGTLFYKLGMFKLAITFLLNLRDRLQHERIMSFLHFDSDEYIAAGGEYTSFAEMMRKFFACNIRLSKTMDLPELCLEHEELKFTMDYPSIVYLELLLFLSNYRLSFYDETISILHDLTSLITNDMNYHIPLNYKAISWQVLGICQEMSGFNNEAFVSYNKALSDPCGSHFRNATLTRIRNLRLDI
ncbi:hypothetical protein FSP39_007018 [Pinctada imbricata]|uniref:Mab-21-like HhH/H2TH-like domain-containing protein n=1 Tax=Pinctada imbricata TaxID=66713 RepID=A0AA89C050_PINIB|nr:hypothetical protein FSP39_007018 [Pinctada imbricata]